MVIRFIRAVVLLKKIVNLHPLDVRTLMSVFRHLIDNSATVIVIEHDLEVIRQADYIVDMGLEGGIQRGRVVGFRNSGWR